MEINKDSLIKICILLLILIILRFLYIRLSDNTLHNKINNNNNNNNIIENFSINNGDSIDLLAKLKNNDIISLDTTNLGKYVIKPWTTKIYNMQSGNQQIKPVALYQPKLLIKNIQYCKLGDMLSQNSDYLPPKSSHFTLLIRKGSSDIKPPVKYDLVVNFGDETVNTNYYEYESFITTPASQAEINSILPNIINCSKIFININQLIQTNLSSLETNLSNEIKKNTNIRVNSNHYNISGLLNNDNDMDISIKDKERSFTLPAGINGTLISNEFTINTGGNRIYNTLKPINVNFNLPSILDSLQTDDKTNIIPYIPNTVFKNMNENNITITNLTFKLNKLLPITSIINIIVSICNDINTIYNKHINNPKFLNHLNLVNDVQTISTILDSIDELNNFLDTYDNINTITLNSNPEIGIYFNNILSIDCGSTILGKVFNIFNNIDIKYKLTYITFTSDNIIFDITSNTQDINMLRLSSFDNKFVSNLPTNSFNLMVNPTYKDDIKLIMKHITDFTLFLNDLQNNTVKNLPLKIYNPIAPKGYVSLGHIFCNIQNQLDEPSHGIQAIDAAGNGVCCIPENCVKEMRDWNISDKMFEYNKNNMYWALYYNPYTGTFISTNTNNLPVGKVSKVVACVKKCTAIDELEKADDCIRNYYNMNKKHSIKLSPDLVADTEEGYYLNKVRAHSDTITKLYKKANSMQLDMDKATILNAEINKNKLQTYVDKQKRNIDIVTKRLEKDNNIIQTNVNIPLDVLNALLNMIKQSEILSLQEKTELKNKLLDNKKLADANLITSDEYDINVNKIMSKCPEYDLSGLVKKDVVSSVCYGCPT